jgi:membrane protease YdiL (CAAX protease family)
VRLGRPNKELVASRPGTKPWLFFALTLGWSWVFWLLAALSGEHVASLPTSILYGLGGLGPLLAALSLLYASETSAARRNYWRRLLDPRRIRGRWWLVILLLPPALSGLAALTYLAQTGSLPRLELPSWLLATPQIIFPWALFILVFGPLPEEMGWRGYALEHLQDSRWSALSASLIVGAVWALWHLPQFFVEGTYQSGLGFGSASFWLFMAVLLPESILITWVYNNTYHSTLSAVLLHFMTNFTGEILGLPDLAGYIPGHDAGFAVVEPD